MIKSLGKGEQQIKQFGFDTFVTARGTL